MKCNNCNNVKYPFVFLVQLSPHLQSLNKGQDMVFQKSYLQNVLTIRIHACKPRDRKSRGNPSGGKHESIWQMCRSFLQNNARFSQYGEYIQSSLNFKS